MMTPLPSPHQVQIGPLPGRVGDAGTVAGYTDQAGRGGRTPAGWGRAGWPTPLGRAARLVGACQASAVAQAPAEPTD